MTMPRRAAVLVLLACLPAFSATEDGWTPLFNGKDLSGWTATGSPGSFSVIDGAIRAKSADRLAHLFYVGPDPAQPVMFGNFELKVRARAEGEANSGIFFHTLTEAKPDGRLDHGYELQLNNGKDKRKTGSLYVIRDTNRSPLADETQWFDVHLTVEGKRIVIRINGEVTADYTEEDPPVRGADRANRRLRPTGGLVALQAHDPASVYWFKDVRVKALPAR